LTKQPGDEGARHSVILSLLVDHSLFMHPDQQRQLQNNLPAYTVGSLRAHVQVECLVDVINDLVLSDNPQEKLKRFTQALYEVFAFGRSKKHMIQRQLGRLEPTPSLKYRAHEVMRTTTVMSTWKNLKTECITNHRLTVDNVVAVAQAGRGRWKIENENNNVLKTQGYHLEHNFGHGKQYLAAFLLSLNLLAFLFHTVLEWSDEQYAVLRRVLARRQTFFQDIQALMRYMVFDHWDHLMAFMIRGLELESPRDTSWAPKLELLRPPAWKQAETTFS
jgi:hypothetical protein